jgi:hypothetical protein
MDTANVGMLHRAGGVSEVLEGRVGLAPAFAQIQLRLTSVLEIVPGTFAVSPAAPSKTMFV